MFDTADVDEALGWNVRAHIYQTVAATGSLPTVEQTATSMNLPVELAARLYRWLEEKHALLLHPDGMSILMASPFSGVPTDFRVTIGDVSYYANCAWDMIGIPAAIGKDARIEAICSDDTRPTTILVKNGKVIGDGELVHILMPAYRWYDDLIYT